MKNILLIVLAVVVLYVWYKKSLPGNGSSEPPDNNAGMKADILSRLDNIGISPADRAKVVSSMDQMDNTELLSMVNYLHSPNDPRARSQMQALSSKYGIFQIK